MSNKKVPQTITITKLELYKILFCWDEDLVESRPRGVLAFIDQTFMLDVLKEPPYRCPICYREPMTDDIICEKCNVQG